MNQDLNPLARELNARLERSSPDVLAMLSPLGRRLYFPKGILTQSAEAREKAHRFNATIGIATEAHEPMHLASVHRHLQGIASADAYDYAPAAGRAGLRERWREKLLAENPSLQDREFGLPIATSALTHGLALAGDLFVEAGDVMLLPDKLWGNYRLLYEVRQGARIVTYPFYAGTGFNVEGFRAALAEQGGQRDKLLVLLNFPNNPTGYAPSEAEADAIADALEAQAGRGTRLVVLVDDAYFGLFYHLDGPCMTESLFGRLVNRHPRLMAVKIDGATKELFVWGLRCGFLTLGPGSREGAAETVAVLEAKLKGAIRSGISNSPHLSQTLVEDALASSSIDEERKQKAEVLRGRAERVHQVANLPRYRESFEVHPFNSGYFMCVGVIGVDAEELRKHLLDRYGVGLIASGGGDLRIAFSCLEVDDVEPLFELVHRAIQELRKD
jgi:aspartate/methionine/tyrosine aminotransferase